MEEFRLGVQKCRKTIQSAFSNKDIYKVRCARIIFHFLRRANDLRTARSHIMSAALKSGTTKIADQKEVKVNIPGKGKSLSGITGILNKKKQDEANKSTNIKKKWGVSIPKV